VAALLDLYRHAWWTRSRSGPQVRRMLRHTDLCVCAWSGRQLAGFARVSTDFTFRAVIWDVIVREGFQGKGLGRALVTRVTRHPRLRQVEGFWLYTTDKQAFYRKLGFKPYPKNLMVLRGARAKAPAR
jgi:ribosomal protein S18 acetylase RimI-like enzyme